MKKAFYPLMIAILLIAISGCSKNNPVSTPAPTPEAQPGFSITALPVTLTGNIEGLTFSAQCTSDDVDLIKVIVQNPKGDSFTYNAGNTLFVKGQVFDCQDAGTGYVKFLGTWKLTFVGNKASGSKASFNVTSTLTVTG